MEESINEQVPKLLNKTAGKASCSIFRVPQNLVKIHPEAFKPQIVSIGPYHYGAKQLEMIQQHKRRFLGAVLDRTKEFGVGLDEFYKVIAIDEKKIRECYSEITDGFNSRQLIEMMILDGIFIIELLCKVGKLVQEDPDDPIFRILAGYGIIENYFGTDEEVVKYFNEASKDIIFDIKRSYLTKLFQEVNEYYKNTWHVRWAEFKYTYFDSPWAFMSALAALILLILTILQSFFAAYGWQGLLFHLSSASEPGEISPEAFEPHIVSIGPYHYGAKRLEMIQQHKRRFLGAVLARTQEFGVGLDEFYQVLAIDEKKIRECYSETTDG
ncbi:hypothetical protein GH714_000999 [Hevea brasiliensis]|uniref:Uncharacterized protein n=1 Tax=Hevea brasiliensis TaxID=3981 RepID=A0A6A6NAZ3_HEVBR|nr:hypothetical protein GH714_000999 [Hevea brasiliensis]